MKALVLAAVLTLGTTAAANAQTDPNARGVPPGDGITQQGTDPEGQACSPPGFNAGTSAYPPCGSTPAASSTPPDSYPACSRTVTDNCVQAYERGVRRPR